MQKQEKKKQNVKFHWLPYNQCLAFQVGAEQCVASGRDTAGVGVTAGHPDAVLPKGPHYSGHGHQRRCHHVCDARLFHREGAWLCWFGLVPVVPLFASLVVVFVWSCLFFQLKLCFLMYLLSSS